MNENRCPYCNGQASIVPELLPECTKCGWYQGRWGLHLKPEETDEEEEIGDMSQPIPHRPVD